MKKLVLLLFIFHFYTFAQPQKEIKNILYLQDQRSLGNGELLKYLASENTDITYAAAVAIANIQDTSCIIPLIRVLDNPQIKNSIGAAFALGQLGLDKRSEEALLNRLKDCDNEPLTAKIFEALGKIGSEESLNKLLDINVSGNLVQYEKILSISRYALRKIKNKDAVSFIIKNISDPNKNIRSACAYALWRIGDRKLIGQYNNEILRLFTDDDTYTKMWTLNVLNSIDEDSIFLKTLLSCFNGTDWKVQVNALKTLEKYVLPERYLNDIIGKVDDANEHISLAAIKYLKKAKIAPDLIITKISNKLITIVKNESNKYTWRQQGEAAISLSEIVLNKEVGFNIIGPLLKSGNIGLRSKAIIALGNLPSPHILGVLLDLIPEKNGLITLNRIESISKLCKKIVIDEEQYQKVKKLFSELLNGGDMAVITTIASTVQDSIFLNMIPNTTLINIFKKLKIPDDVEPMVEIINTLAKIDSPEVINFLESTLNNEDKTVVTAAALGLKKITGRNYDYKIPSNSKVGYSDYNWLYLERISKDPYMTIRTEKGDIKIKLFVNDAPFTVLSFKRLIDKKFFDNLVFHRVVSNFVIQGGDPRGDGWGGPGYSIRTEISLQDYKEGMVGVASAGKDTEGCQFFITHSPQPHLDGRYTIFGEVIEGMGVVDKIQERDKILTVF